MNAATASPGAKEAVILLGTDTPIGLAVTRDLGRHGFLTVGIGRRKNALAGASKHCHHHVVREEGEAGLIAQIMALAKQHQAGYLLAIGESDLLLLNRHREELEELVNVLVPGAEKLAQVLDKATCQNLARDLGIAIPETRRFTSLEEAREVAAGLTYPLVLKWSDPHEVIDALDSAGLELIKTDYAQDPADLLVRLAPYAAIGSFPLVQDYCPGHGLGQMFLVQEGEVLMEFQHERLHEWPPEGGASTLCRSVPLDQHQAARERSRALLQRLQWSGVAMVEYRFDPEKGRYVFMEINGRFWGSLPLATAAGLPFAAGLVAHCGGANRQFPLPRDYPALTACYWIPETKRLLRLLFQRRKIADPFYRPAPLRALLSYMAFPLRPSGRWFIFQPSDPKPFFADLAAVFAKLLRGR